MTDRSVICWLIVSSIFFCVPQVGLAKNQAASKIAAKIYESANDQIMAKQWKQALWNLEIVSFLDPNFEFAILKAKKLEEELQKEKEKFYLDGLRAYQTLHYEEAKFYWRMAFQYMMDPKDPLKSKIEKALALNQNIPRTPSSLPSEVIASSKEREPMGNVRQFLESGDTSQAILSLKEIVYTESTNERAQNVLARLQTSYKGQSGSESLSQEIHVRFKKAEELSNVAKEAQEKKDFRNAYSNYKEALSLFQGDDLKPPFYKELEVAIQAVEERLQKDLKPLLDRWDTEFRQQNLNLKESGLKLKEIVKKYPPNTQAEELLQKIYAQLQAKAEPTLMKAITTQELEGCPLSAALYERAKEIAAFPEVPAWGEADRYLAACKPSLKPGE